MLADILGGLAADGLDELLGATGFDELELNALLGEADGFELGQASAPHTPVEPKAFESTEITFRFGDMNEAIPIRVYDRFKWEHARSGKGIGDFLEGVLNAWNSQPPSA